MSPSLFNFFINDIFEELDGFTPAGVSVPSTAPDDLRCPGLLFADNVVFMAESADDLKAALMHVERWADLAKMWDKRRSQEGLRNLYVVSKEPFDTVTQSGGRIQGHGAPHPYLGLRTPSC